MSRGKRYRLVDPEYTDIICPWVRGGLLGDDPARVTWKSPAPLRRAVYRLARYFQREFRYDFVQYGYEGREDDPDAVAFLWPHVEAVPGDDRFSFPVVGACCFRWRDWSDAPASWAFQWAWLHPYFRRRGLLSGAWPAFRAEFGGFVVEPPLSDAMAAFLRKAGECASCAGPWAGGGPWCPRCRKPGPGAGEK